MFRRDSINWMHILSQIVIQSNMGQSKRMYEQMEINVLDIDLDDDEYQFKEWIEKEYEKYLAENPNSPILAPHN